MKDLWFPILILLGIVAIALTGGAKNYQTTSNTSAPPEVVPPEYNPPVVPPPGSSGTTISAYPPSQSQTGSGQVNMEFGSYGVTNANQEYIEIDSNPSNTGFVDLTGWTLHSKWSGQSVKIPQSVSLYFANSTNGLEDIYLAPGEHAFIITGRSPLGVGMHVNICSGYLSQYNSTSGQQIQFTPNFSTSCPLARDENLSSIPHTVNNANCFDMINSIGSCQNGPTLNNTYSYECQQFVETKLNYQTCVDTHKNDVNFYSPKEWYVYLNRDTNMWQNSRYEDIVLIDPHDIQQAEIKGY